MSAVALLVKIITSVFPLIHPLRWKGFYILPAALAPLENTRPDVWEQLLSFVWILKSHTIHGFPSHINNVIRKTRSHSNTFTCLNQSKQSFVFHVDQDSRTHWMNEPAMHDEMRHHKHGGESLTNALNLRYLIQTLYNSCTVHDSCGPSRDPDRSSLMLSIMFFQLHTEYFLVTQFLKAETQTHTKSIKPDTNFQPLTQFTTHISLCNTQEFILRQRG